MVLLPPVCSSQNFIKLCETKHGTALNRNRNQKFKLVGAGTHGWSIRASWDACRELRWAELCKSPLPPCISELKVAVDLCTSLFIYMLYSRFLSSNRPETLQSLLPSKFPRSRISTVVNLSTQLPHIYMLYSRFLSLNRPETLQSLLLSEFPWSRVSNVVNLSTQLHHLPCIAGQNWCKRNPYVITGFTHTHKPRRATRDKKRAIQSSDSTCHSSSRMPVLDHHKHYQKWQGPRPFQNLHECHLGLWYFLNTRHPTGDRDEFGSVTKRSKTGLMTRSMGMIWKETICAWRLSAVVKREPDMQYYATRYLSTHDTLSRSMLMANLRSRQR